MPSNSSKKRLVYVFITIILITLLLVGRLGYLQIVIGEELKKGALQQWTKGVDIKSKRGVIYDRKGKKLAVSISAQTIWARPADIEDPDKTARIVAEILDMDEELVYEKITKKQSLEKIKQWVTKEEANEIRNLRIPGIETVDDNKRYYPYGDFASYILGFTDIDNIGLDGIEKAYDRYLMGTPGRWFKTTDAKGRQLPYDGERIYEASDGLSVVLTIDETIQHFAEKAAFEALAKNKAKNVSIVIMDPRNGDVLAIANAPDYDPNNPREPLDDNLKREWEELSQEELQKRWYAMWRNYSISDIYEPGSTFKLFTAAAAIEENTAKLESHYYCNGFIRDIKGEVLKCSRWYNPHGSQTLVEGMNNSCNVVFVNVGRNLGKEKFHKYIKAFGFGENTGIDLLGEQAGIIPYNTDIIKEIQLATMSYGHGIAITPIQLVNGVSSLVNGGHLMKPRIVKEMIDNNGNIVVSFKPEIKRRVISEDTSKKMLYMMEQVVLEGSGRNSYVPGFRIGGKTGTAQKIIDGRYAQGKYIGSFAGVAPIDDPQLALAIIIDEPSAGQYYGGTVAAPVAKGLFEDILNYLEIPPKYSEEEMKIGEEKVIVPDIRNKKIGDVGKTLTDMGLRYTTEYLEITSDTVVLDQFPLPGVEVLKGSIIDLYLNEREPEKIIVPDLTGKNKNEVIHILDELNLNYEFVGNGIATSQSIEPGVEIQPNENIKVEFSDTKR